MLQPTNLKNEAFSKELEAFQANLQVVVAFRMLPKMVWNMPEYGTFNLHASLLPEYRGAAPINWAIMNGETKTGVTTFFIDDKIDTGEIILQRELTISEDETAGELHDRLMVLGASLVLETVSLIALDKASTRKQTVDGKLKSAPKIHKDNCKIEWYRSLDDIHHHIRGLSPYPGAWTTLRQGSEELPLKIYRASREPRPHDLATGTIITDKNDMKVAVAEGFINLLEIQLPGKKRMNVSDVLNGLKLKKKCPCSLNPHRYWAERNVTKGLLYQQTNRLINKNADFPLFYLCSQQIPINLF